MNVQKIWLTKESFKNKMTGLRIKALQPLLHVLNSVLIVKQSSRTEEISKFEYRCFY